MWQRIYLHRLKRDLDLWIERGWVSRSNAEAIILSATSANTGTKRLPGILAILGAVLIGFAAMSFVAANWSEMSKLARLTLIFGSMWTAYGAAWLLHRRGHSAYAQAAILIGLALFGAGIMLIAQIYHIVTDDPGGVLAWCIAALATAWLLSSRPALAAGILLAITWSWFVVGKDGHSVHWTFWLAWLASIALAWRLSWMPGLHLALLAGILWHILNIGIITSSHHISEIVILPFLVIEALAIWLVGLLISAKYPRPASILESYGMILSAGLVFLLQIASPYPDEYVISHQMYVLIIAAIVVVALAGFAYRQGHKYPQAVIALTAILALAFPLLGAWSLSLTPWVYAAAIFVLSAWFVYYGTNIGSRFAVNLGFVLFTAEALYLYFEKLGTLLDTALFFALGGILLIAGSLVMERMRRRLIRIADEAQEGDTK